MINFPALFMIDTRALFMINTRPDGIRTTKLPLWWSKSRNPPAMCQKSSSSAGVSESCSTSTGYLHVQHFRFRVRRLRIYTINRYTVNKYTIWWTRDSDRRWQHGRAAPARGICAFSVSRDQSYMKRELDQNLSGSEVFSLHSMFFTGNIEELMQ